MRHVGHNSLYMVGILTYKADITGHVTKRNEKEMNRKKTQNLAMALGISFGKFMTGYETCFLKKFIHRSRTNKYVIRVHLYKMSG